MGHTPGPWFVNGDCVEADGPEGPRDVTVAVVHGHPHNTVRAANARLIAAAPELLKTLRFILPVLENAARRGTIDSDGVNLELEAAREVASAIAKAEGKSE